jgi:hypothetical protein
MRAVKGSLGHSPKERHREIENWKALARLMARPGKSIAMQSEGRAGQKYLPVGGLVGEKVSRSGRSISPHQGS